MLSNGLSGNSRRVAVTFLILFLYFLVLLLIGPRKERITIKNIFPPVETTRYYFNDDIY